MLTLTSHGGAELGALVTLRPAPARTMSASFAALTPPAAAISDDEAPAKHRRSELDSGDRHRAARGKFDAPAPPMQANASVVRSPPGASSASSASARSSRRPDGGDRDSSGMASFSRS